MDWNPRCCFLNPSQFHEIRIFTHSNWAASISIPNLRFFRGQNNSSENWLANLPETFFFRQVTNPWISTDFPLIFPTKPMFHDTTATRLTKVMAILISAPASVMAWPQTPSGENWAALSRGIGYGKGGSCGCGYNAENQKNKHVESSPGYRCISINTYITIYIYYYIYISTLLCIYIYMYTNINVTIYIFFLHKNITE